MIRKECFTKEWIETVRDRFKYNDVNLIEKVIRAFSLVEMLSESGCPYIWKGGSCLMLLLRSGLHRLSIDVDIVCPPGTDIEQYLSKFPEYGFTGRETIELVRTKMGKDPLDGSVYVFINARRDRIKLLHMEPSGLVLYTKVLERGELHVPQRLSGPGTKAIEWRELMVMIEGMIVDEHHHFRRVRRVQPYRNAKTRQFIPYYYPNKSLSVTT